MEFLKQTQAPTLKPAATIRLGIVSALQEEQDGILQQMQDVQVLRRGMRDYSTGRLWGVDCVCVLARIGKVGAAATTTMLIAEFGVSHILFTGVAGGADSRVKVGDIVLAQDLVQHDMDCRPLFPRYEIPLTGKTLFAADTALNQQVFAACQQFLSEDFTQAISANAISSFSLQNCQLHRGLIASGDEFINDAAKLQQIKTAWPELLAVEMEGAAVAQICHEFDVPFAVIRTISDSANEAAAVDFARFIEQVAAHYAYAIVRNLCHQLSA